jgi:hypothetical protein
MTGGENRRKSILKALRKRRLYPDYYNNLHQYSKNKIHCSCPLCSCKTNNKGGRAGHCWAPTSNYKISDLRKINRLEYLED